jgi:hypothetical protein
MTRAAWQDASQHPSIRRFWRLSKAIARPKFASMRTAEKPCPWEDEMLELKDLDDQSRPFMVAEVDADVAKGAIYLSPRLTASGLREFPKLLRQACDQFDATWLASRLLQGRYISETEAYFRSGRRHTRKVNITQAAEMLAEGEFNRFYARGLCLRAMDAGVAEVVVYRAKAVSHARPESKQLIGSKIAAESLLADLREHVGRDTDHGMPGGPNSGLSVCLER